MLRILPTQDKESHLVLATCTICHEIIARDHNEIVLAHQCQADPHTEEWFKRYVNKHNLDFSHEFIKNTWLQQNGRCQLLNFRLSKKLNRYNSAIFTKIRGNYCWVSRLSRNRSVRYLIEYHQQATQSIRLEYKLRHPDAKAPFRKRHTDAGYDLSSVEDRELIPHQTINIDTGINVSCPPGTYYTIMGRSSLRLKGIIPGGALIDATYCGPLHVALTNTSNEPYQVKVGDRIAQMVVQRQVPIDLVPVKHFGFNYDQRGENGFGSTGR